MYTRKEEVDGMVVDPLKALHQVQGSSLSYKDIFYSYRQLLFQDPEKLTKI